MNRFAVNTLIVFFGLTVGQVAFADNVTIPNVFQSGSPARASEVNDNFSAVEASVDDNAAEIATSKTNVADIDQRVGTLETGQVLQDDLITTNNTNVTDITQRVDALEAGQVLQDDSTATAAIERNLMQAELQTALDNGRRGWHAGDTALLMLDRLISTLGLTCAEANYGLFYGCTQIAAGDGTVWDINQLFHDRALAIVLINDAAVGPGVPFPYVIMAQTNSGQPGDMIVAGSANLFRWNYRDADDVDRLVDDCDNPTTAMSPVSTGGTSTRWRLNNGAYYYVPYNASTGTLDILAEIDVTGQMVGIVKNIAPFGVFDPSTVEWCVMSDQVTGIYNSYELQPYPFDLNEARFSLPLTPQ